MTLRDALLLFPAAVIAGAMNSVAGGGSFFTFPALLFTGVPAISANATSTVAVWPGSLASAAVYRKRLPRRAHTLVPLGVASLAGGLAGAGLLLHTPPRTFLRLIPFLFLIATSIFAFGKRLFKHTKSEEQIENRPPLLLVGSVTALQFATAVYGGFFGAGMGILILAFLSALPLGDIHAVNAVKTLLVTVINGVAIVAFVAAKIIYWPQGVLMLIGGILGGYAGAHYAQKVNPAKVRATVIFVGFAMSFIFLWKYR
jgi:uncharacterized membrane protein YfcA